MKLGTRLFFGFFLLVGVGLIALLNLAQDQMRPAAQKASEQTLVDTANLLAELAAEQFPRGFGPETPFAQAVSRYQQRFIKAQIFSQRKNTPDFELYITDAAGQVIFHTDADEIGKNYSWWRDVNLTLQGEYGARTTRTDPGSEWSSVMYVAAPIYRLGEIVGVLTVSQPSNNLQPFLNLAASELWQQAWLILGVALVLGGLLSWWLARSIRTLVAYVEALREGRKASAPELHVSELDALAKATRDMHEEIQGKAYVENYIHTLAHEMKSPLSAVRGAAEILQDMPHDRDAQRFLNNIDQESQRMQSLIDRLLSLASVEKQQSLQDSSRIDLGALVQDCLDSKLVAIQKKSLALDWQSPGEPLTIRGDRFLLEQAVSNILHNAIEFSPPGATVALLLSRGGEGFVLQCRNRGTIPDYALERIFERFYSLPRPDSGRKSTGLGLSFVREVMALHKGDITLENEPPATVCATLTLS